MTTLILLAGGIGKRANLGLPKQYYRIEEKMIIEYTLENVSKVGGIDRLILVSNPQFMDTALELAESFPKIETVTIGGKTRNESMYNGFKEVPPGETKVIVHDAVRPFTPRWVFEKIIDLLDEMDVVTTVNPITGNLIELDNGKVKRIHDRSRYAMGEAPTGYRYDALKKTLETALSRGILNEIPHDILLAMEAGFNVHVLHCNCFNLKITFREDVEIARTLIKVLEEQR
ncbi:cytidylyltransferase [Thermococcus kodakarensis KOD1]|uniref:Cytidylyltransferase n=1 Tax=Thermococcus kodakarensis (strain ATCC BAA-918 / JCM 12380 / KOD1) TaxID=69014 RepID=Q5JJ28_THEKO|nr:2-C-methyl-D-erythritol 4-phosphate cytidylyltransferase [Thermococcus kodakarensis]WCN27634.1 2-C-methyl-D-erythritol 4-phosphate cytidylyltransferase [Thermococcus kodakarensis]WCN29925.1 2-C-methyl-D-erythritol 4-phosphate cytidylyltransferase [Thermococcus kodakarensis]BAD85905.1 cytidylyltransferase [Thermococcus kodakarensis KOD1]